MSQQKQALMRAPSREATSGFRLRETADHRISVLLAGVFTLLSGIVLVAATISL